MPLAEGFAQIARYIEGSGRPLTSFCACELRSPAAFTDDGFRAFNQHYVKTLAEWGLYDGTTNPVARSNVCPEIDPPAEPSFYAYSFTRPSSTTNRLPWPSALSTLMVPPLASASRFASDRPRPIPLLLVVNNGSNIRSR